MGIIGNEKADLIANEAADLSDDEITEEPTTLKDLRARIKKHYREVVRLSWEAIDPSKNKLRKIKKVNGLTKNLSKLKRKDSVKITRLRLGHTRLTHGHLMTSESVKTCICAEPLTVEHIFNNCPIYRKAREKYKIRSVYTLSIDKEKNYENIIKFLKKTKLYYEI